MTEKASWEWDFILANPVIDLLWNIKSSVLSLKWQSSSSNIVLASNQKKSWWGCEEAECGTKQVYLILGCSTVLLKLLNTRAQLLGKSPAGSYLMPSLSAVCSYHLCVLNSPRHVPWCLCMGAYGHPIWARDPAVPGTPVSWTSVHFCPLNGSSPPSQPALSQVVDRVQDKCFYSYFTLHSLPYS